LLHNVSELTGEQPFSGGCAGRIFLAEYNVVPDRVGEGA
jgi:hypothetical protein